MKKDAYYFPHYSNARNDRKIRRLKKNLSFEGYAVFFMILEVLRDQPDFKYPLDDIDLLADEFGTKEEIVEKIILNYELFEKDSFDNFYSPKLLLYMQPYIEKTEQARKAANIRWYKVKPPEQKMKGTQFYILRCYDDIEQFIKIGITKTTISRRFNGKIPYNYEVLKQYETEYPKELEKEYLNKFETLKYHPKSFFSGNQECIKIDCINEVLNFKPQTSFSEMHQHCESNALVLQGKERKGKERKEKKKKVDTNLPDYPLEVKDFCDHSFEKLKSKHGKSFPKNTKIESWYQEIDKIIRLDDFNMNEVSETLISAIEDNFWGKQVISFASLRKKDSDGITKFQKLYNKFYNKNNSLTINTGKDRYAHLPVY